MPGAGCMFTDGVRVLAGYQNKTGKISGFGGKSNEGETAIQTALRETVEELFGVEVVTVELIAKLPVSDHRIDYPQYTCFIYSFTDLETFLRRSKRVLGSSSLYEEFPETLGDLLFRRISGDDCEVSELYLLPARNTPIAGSFKRDLIEGGLY